MTENDGEAAEETLSVKDNGAVLQDGNVVLIKDPKPAAPWSSRQEPR